MPTPCRRRFHRRIPDARVQRSVTQYTSIRYSPRVLENDRSICRGIAPAFRLARRRDRRGRPLYSHATTKQADRQPARMRARAPSEPCGTMLKSCTRSSPTLIANGRSPAGTSPSNKALLDTDIYSEILKAVDQTVTWNAIAYRQASRAIVSRRFTLRYFPGRDCTAYSALPPRVHRGHLRGIDQRHPADRDRSWIVVVGGGSRLRISLNWGLRSPRRFL